MQEHHLTSEAQRESSSAAPEEESESGSELHSSSGSKLEQPSESRVTNSESEVDSISESKPEAEAESELKRESEEESEQELEEESEQEIEEESEQELEEESEAASELESESESELESESESESEPSSESESSLSEQESTPLSGSDEERETEVEPETTVDADDPTCVQTSSSNDKDEKEPAPSVQTTAEIALFHNTYPGIIRRYKLLDKIGEGTFSTVYKAIDLRQHKYDNSQWIKCTPQGRASNSNLTKHRYVAIKRLYVTSSPERIANEISVLHDLSGHDSVVPIISAHRYEDQVLVVLPYFKHEDFREYYLNFTVASSRSYFRSLFRALAHTHAHRVIHRDVKPSNFLYDPISRTGTLVDFGLAERAEDDDSAEEGEDYTEEVSETGRRRKGSGNAKNKRRKENVPPGGFLCTNEMEPGYLKGDTRPSVRASRAGTRGFRAPEVLLKVVKQTVAIDIWSAGVILLCIMTRTFPFFNSTDDIEALGELTCLFGKTKMADFAAKQNRTFHTNIPNFSFKDSKLEKYARFLHCRDDGFEHETFPASALDLLKRCMTLDPTERITAARALRHPFLRLPSTRR